MMKRAVFFPFLFVLYVILNPLLNNLGQVDPALAARPLVLLFLLTAAGMAVLYAAFRDWQYAGYLTFLGLVFVFVFGHLSRVLQDQLGLNPGQFNLILLAAWGMLLIILGLRRTWARLGGRRLTYPLNVILAVAVLSQVLVAAPRVVQAGLGPTDEADPDFLPETGVPKDLDCTAQPDIYYLVLDGYGRADVLEEIYGVENDSFLDFLEQKGFYVAEQSHSNYIQTIFSISSALNFTPIGPEPPRVSGQVYFADLIADNRVMELLEGCGYETVAFETGFYFTNHPEVSLYLSSGVDLNEFESLLLAGSPVDVLAEALDLMPPEHSYQAQRDRVLNVFSELRRLPERPGPQFVFAHIISPHPPFVFDAEGNPIEPWRSYSMADGNDFRGSWEEYREGYAGQVQFVNRMLNETIEKILAESDTPPIIILQGDHGPGGHLNWSSPGRTCLWERTGILNAYYLPDGAAAELYPEISPVNTFRVILNEYFGADLSRLPDKTYFTSHRLPRRIIDITPQRDSRANCDRR